ncbi:MAG TPA: hypothetical protein VGA13_10245 [Acidimicrobiales bacterium]
MPDITILSDSEIVVTGELADHRCVVTSDDLHTVTGWELKTEGLCRDDVCVPVPDRSTLGDGDGRVDVGAVAAALDRRLVTDPERAVAALSVDRSTRLRTVTSGEVVDVTLPDLDGSAHRLSEWSGTKKLLVCWASW